MRCDKAPKSKGWWVPLASARRLVRMAPIALERNLVGPELQSQSLANVADEIWPIRAPLLARLLRALTEAGLLLPLLGRIARPLCRPLERRSRKLTVWIPSELRDILVAVGAVRW